MGVLAGICRRQKRRLAGQSKEDSTPLVGGRPPRGLGAPQEPRQNVNRAGLGRRESGRRVVNRLPTRFDHHEQTREASLHRRLVHHRAGPCGTTRRVNH